MTWPEKDARGDNLDLLPWRGDPPNLDHLFPWCGCSVGKPKSRPIPSWWRRRLIRIGVRRQLGKEGLDLNHWAAWAFIDEFRYRDLIFRRK